MPGATGVTCPLPEIVATVGSEDVQESGPTRAWAIGSGLVTSRTIKFRGTGLPINVSGEFWRMLIRVGGGNTVSTVELCSPAACAEIVVGPIPPRSAKPGDCAAPCALMVATPGLDEVQTTASGGGAPAGANANEN